MSLQISYKLWYILELLSEAIVKSSDITLETETSNMEQTKLEFSL